MFSMVLFGLLLWCVGCATATTTFAPTPQPTVSELSVVSGGLTVEGISLEHDGNDGPEAIDENGGGGEGSIAEASDEQLSA